jgi:stage II sporulation protein AB (anti-sigma F factor)
VHGLRLGGYPIDVPGATDLSDAIFSDPDRVNLTLEAAPENAAVARRAVVDAAEQVGLDEETVSKARLVVSEAFSNAAIHAYPEGSDGEIEIAAYPAPSGITVVVRDRGEGLRPRPASGSPSERLGLLLIAALATTTRLRQRPGGGTELRADILAAQPSG